MECMEFDLKEMHKVQLNLFKRFQSVCQDHSLTYFLGFGTLIGAVREHKIIDWDDSIDIVMPYRDYDKLLKLPQDVWGSGYFLQTYDSDPAYKKCYAKLRDSTTTLILAEDIDLDMNHGIPINIYPIVKLADDAGERQTQIRNAKLYKVVTEGRTSDLEDSLLSTFVNMFLEVSSLQQRIKIRERLKNETLKFENENTGCCLVLAGKKSLSLVLFTSWFSSAAVCEFEGLKANIPEGWQEWLKLRYGDYMRQPITELQDSKISDFVTLNPSKAYTYYKGRTYCV